MKYPPGLVVTIFTFQAYHANEKSKTFFHKTRLIPLLIKISESFKIQSNILEILRNKQGKKIVTTYPKVGVSCYSTWGKLLHLIKYYFIVSLAQPNMI